MPPPLDTIEQSLASIFQKVEHQLEPLRTAVVGVGHVISIRVMTAIIGHAVDFLFRLWRRSQLSKVIQVAVVHADNQIKLQEVISGYRARAVSQLVATASRMASHTRIRQFAAMITQDAGRIDEKLILTTFTLYKLFHHTLRCRRTADIAQTDK